jgi:hypothetical protein
MNQVTNDRIKKIKIFFLGILSVLSIPVLLLIDLANRKLASKIRTWFYIKVLNIATK